jgi:hypothetical protein
MTKMLPAELKQAIPIPPEDAGITISVGRDGVWLHFKSAMGLHASFNINSLKGGAGVTSAALAQWCLDRQEQACDIYALLPAEARATPHDHLTREYAMGHANTQTLIEQNLDFAARLTALTAIIERVAAFVKLPPDDIAALVADPPQASVAEPALSAQPSGDDIDREYEPSTPAAVTFATGTRPDETNPD